ncbi:ATP-dependent nuclease [Undibacterium flavidum]|uniref:ATP-binding protein n=1 Tax=Undibacterium flavidum TaxID=2762297 RepID=A0ABR6YG26_9BURK|nr:AAA family ATPase [Undibacterium flavidum]MBC3875520.1 ATP-binding protein [Undibacterium flavidum]
MKITNIVIKNFRSLKEVEFQPSGFNVLVGRNNHGKSNIFEAIEWFYSGKGELSELRYVGAEPGEEVIVEITFSGVQTDIAYISNVDNQQKIRNIIGDSEMFQVRRTSADAKSRYIFNSRDKKWQKQPTGADSAFNNCIPRFEFILTDKNLKEVSAFKSTTPIGQMLSNVVSEALEKDAKYIEFKNKFEELFQSPDSSVKKLLQETSERVKSHLALQFPDCTSLEFKVEIPPFEDFLKSYTTTVDDGVATSADAKGDGMQRALMLAIIKAHADARRSEALGKAFLFFIDEAELHLHPMAQRQLKNALSTLADSVDQVFITTHSSVFLSDKHPQQAEFVVEKEEGATTVQAMNNRERMRTVYELLGGSPTDLLLPANFLIVEGPSEVAFIEQVCKRYYQDKPRIQIVAAAGDDERQAQYLGAIMKAFAPLGDSPIYKNRAVLLFDKPTGTDKEQRLQNFLDEHPHIRNGQRAHVLPTLGLEEYYPATERAKFAAVTKKVPLATRIGRTISRELFEDEMKVIFSALEACWDKAYGV